jgi:hypothetical protein
MNWRPATGCVPVFPKPKFGLCGRDRHICIASVDAMADFRDVDPRELRVPPSRREGADPAKLARQIALFGRSAVGMPAPWVYEGSDGVLMLYNGVTRATRIAKLAPGTLIRVEVIGKLPRPYASDPKIGDLLP